MHPLNIQRDNRESVGRRFLLRVLRALRSLERNPAAEDTSAKQRVADISGYREDLEDKQWFALLLYSWADWLVRARPPQSAISGRSVRIGTAQLSDLIPDVQSAEQFLRLADIFVFNACGLADFEVWKQTFETGKLAPERAPSEAVEPLQRVTTALAGRFIIGVVVDDSAA